MECSQCEKTFTQRQTLFRHQREQHGDNIYQCSQCSQSFSRNEHLLWHKRTHAKRSAAALLEEPPAQISSIEPEDQPSIEEVTTFLESTPYSDKQEKALRGYLTSYWLKYTQQQVDPIYFMTNLTVEISQLISTHDEHGIKLWICLFNRFVGVCLRSVVSSLYVRLTLCKPIYVGFTVLELSKTLMYDFHYGYINPKYGDWATLLFTDTDSLSYHIETDNIYDDMLEDNTLFDTSDYPQDHPLHSNTNKKVLGKMKDGTVGSPISGFCGLRSKMYSFKCDGIEKKRAKGIKNCISHTDYVNSLFEESSMRHSINLIRSHRHEIYSMTLTKKSLSAYDDKRCLMDNVSRFAYGHVATNSYKYFTE